MYILSVNFAKTTDKNDKTYDTIQVNLEQKPCHIKMAHLTDSTIFLLTYIGAVHNKITDNKLTM